MFSLSQETRQKKALDQTSVCEHHTQTEKIKNKKQNPVYQNSKNIIIENSSPYKRARKGTGSLAHSFHKNGMGFSRIFSEALMEVC